jgi:predicted DNA-binding protein
MPTTNPRLSITMSPEDLAILNRYAKASGTPRATLVAELIKSAIPQLQEAAELIELANAAPRKIKQDLVDNLANATADAMGFLQPFNSTYRTVLNSLQYELIPDPPVGARGVSGMPGMRQRPQSAGGASRGPDGPSDPHLLTGGSKS